ncbi:MAG: hypothetical protein AAF871_01040 [Pseudomonadota bacterium]
MGAKTRIRVHGSAARAVIGGREIDDPESIIPVVGTHVGGVVRPNYAGSIWCWVPVPIHMSSSGDTTKIVGARIDFQRNFIFDQRATGEIDLGNVEVARGGGGPPIAQIHRNIPRQGFASSAPEFEVLERAFFANGEGVPVGENSCAVGIQFFVHPRSAARPETNIAIFSAEVTVEDPD